MVKLCEPYRLCRSLIIRHIRRQNIIDYGNTTRLFQPFITGHADHLLTTLFSSKDRNPNLHGRFPYSKSSKYCRHDRCFSRCFSHHGILKTGTEDSIDVLSPTYLSFEQSSSSVTSLDKNDSFELFLEPFPRKIKRNVNDIISKVDSETSKIADRDNEVRITAQSNVSPENVPEMKKRRTSLSSMKTSLRKRWERILGAENERHHRRKKIRLKKRKVKNTKSSIETLWDEAFRRNGYCVVPKFNKEQRESGRIYGWFVRDSNLSEEQKKDESLHGIHISPIFCVRVNQRHSLIDCETPLSIEGIEDNDDLIDHVEVQRVLISSEINEQEVKGYTRDVHSKAILESISLLKAMRSEDWQRYDSSMRLHVERKKFENNDFRHETRVRQELGDNDADLNQIHENTPKIRHILRHVMERKYVLTTSLANLLLAHFVASIENESQDIGEGCLRIFEEMKMLAESGQYECRPDSTTYRILILAFGRRLQGIGEAVKLSQEMVECSSFDINPELLNDALKACRAKTELIVARLLMNSALNNPRIRINGESCIIYTEMLKTRKLHQEAIDLFSRIKKTYLLTKDEEDEYLISLCRWPQRSRRGDVLDLFSFWTDILRILEQNMLSPKIPDIRVWITFLEGLYISAQSDDSLWKLTAGGTRTVLDSYPRGFVGRKLMTIGLDASCSMEDPELASSILKKFADEVRTPNNPSNNIANCPKTISCPAMVPFRALKNSLKICLRTSDAKSAKSIQESLDQIGTPYPIGARSELYSLVLLCHTKVNDAENAKRDLQMMIENNMKPSEELYGEVLRTLAEVGRYQEMEELFHSIQTGNEVGIKPGISSYNAIQLARIKEKSWGGVISLYEQMKVGGIIPSSRTVEGIIVASDQNGGRASTLSALESLLQCNAQFDESAFRLASKTLFQDVDKNLDDFRKNIREIGERNKCLRIVSLDLVRSIRFAEIERSRPKIVNESKYVTKHSGEDAWRLATSHLLAFVQAWLENKDGKE